MTINVRLVGVVVVLDMCGKLIKTTSQDFLDEFQALINAQRYLIVLNFAHLTKIDHVGYSALIQARGALELNRGGMRIICATGPIRNQLIESGFVRSTPIFDAEAPAICSLHAEHPVGLKLQQWA